MAWLLRADLWLRCNPKRAGRYAGLALGLACLLLGFIGFRHQGDTEVDAVYDSLALFAGAFPDLTKPIGVGLHVARIGALVVAFGAIATVLEDLFKVPYTRWIAVKSRRHIVVLGSRPEAALLAERQSRALRWPWWLGPINWVRPRRRCVLVLEPGASPPPDSAGMIVIRRDSRSLSKVVSHADKVFLLDESDAGPMLLNAVLDAQHVDLANIHLGFGNLELSSMLHATHLAVDETGASRPDIFNLTRRTISQALKRFRPDLLNATCAIVIGGGRSADHLRDRLRRGWSPLTVTRYRFSSHDIDATVVMVEHRIERSGNERHVIYVLLEPNQDARAMTLAVALARSHRVAGSGSQVVVISQSDLRLDTHRSRINVHVVSQANVLVEADQVGWDLASQLRFEFELERNRGDGGALAARPIPPVHLIRAAMSLFIERWATLSAAATTFEFAEHSPARTSLEHDLGRVDHPFEVPTLTEQLARTGVWLSNRHSFQHEPAGAGVDAETDTWLAHAIAHEVARSGAGTVECPAQVIRSIDEAFAELGLTRTRCGPRTMFTPQQARVVRDHLAASRGFARPIGTDDALRLALQLPLVLGRAGESVAAASSPGPLLLTAQSPLANIVADQHELIAIEALSPWARRRRLRALRRRQRGPRTHLESLAAACQATYVSSQATSRTLRGRSKLPPARRTMKKWSELDEDARAKNRDLVLRIIGQLATAGLTIRATDRHFPGNFLWAIGKPGILEEFAAFEHQAWLAGKLADGWVLADHRDDDLKLNPSLVGWAELATMKNPGAVLARNANLAYFEQLEQILRCANLELVPPTAPKERPRPAVGSS